MDTSLDSHQSASRGQEPLEPDVPAGLQTLQEFGRIIFRYRRRAIIFFVATMALVIVGLVVAPRKYASEGKLFVGLGRENVALDPTATTGQVIGLNNSRESEMNSVVEMLGSRSIIEGVVDNAGLVTPNASPEERDKVIRKLIRKISVSLPRNSTVVSVVCESSTPERAQKIVATLLETYLAEHSRMNSTAGSFKFFSEQCEQLQAQLKEADDALRNAKNRYGLVSLEGCREALQSQITSVETGQLETEAALSETEAKIAALRSSLEGLPDPLVHRLVGGSPNDGFADMREQLYRLQTREQELVSKYTEQHPGVIAIREQVRQTQKILQIERPDRTQSANAVLLTEDTQVKSLRARAASLDRQRARLEEDLQLLNEREVHIEQLKRNVKVVESNYLDNKAKLEQARIGQDLKAEGITNARVSQNASFEPKPVSPNVAITLAIALVIATFGAMGVALLLDQLDRASRTADAVGNAGRVEPAVAPEPRLPTLASIPDVRHEPLAVGTNSNNY